MSAATWDEWELLAQEHRLFESNMLGREVSIESSREFVALLRHVWSSVDCSGWTWNNARQSGVITEPEE